MALVKNEQTPEKHEKSRPRCLDNIIGGVSIRYCTDRSGPCFTQYVSNINSSACKLLSYFVLFILFYF